MHCVTAVKTGVDEEEATRLMAGGAQLILVSIDREGGSIVRRDRSFWTLTTRAGGSIDAGDEVDAVALVTVYELHTRELLEVDVSVEPEEHPRSLDAYVTTGSCELDLSSSRSDDAMESFSVAGVLSDLSSEYS